jgi:hypothetical protein
MYFKRIKYRRANTICKTEPAQKEMIVFIDILILLAAKELRIVLTMTEDFADLDYNACFYTTPKRFVRIMYMDSVLKVQSASNIMRRCM